MGILLDGRPIRFPVSGVARYCLSLANALTQLQQSGELSDLPPVEVLVQDERGTNACLSTLDRTVAKADLSLFGRRRKTQNVITEFVPYVASLTALRRFSLVHETYFANLGSHRRHRKVATIHDVIPLDYPQFYNHNNRFFSRRNFSRQAAESDAIISVSNYTKNRILALSDYPEERIHIIGCGVDSAAALAANRAVWPIAGQVQPDDSYGLYIGNIEPRKNLRGLIDAWTRLRSDHDGVSLVVAGSLNYQAEPDVAYGRDKLGSRFRYVGMVPEPEKWALLKRARLLVLPSLYEGYGIPIIEAYTARTLALFSRNSSMVELAHDDRQMFDPHSIDEMAVVIGGALEEPAWVEQVRRSAEAWVADHSWAAVARAVASVYKRILA